MKERQKLKKLLDLKKIDIAILKNSEKSRIYGGEDTYDGGATCGSECNETYQTCGATCGGTCATLCPCGSITCGYGETATIPWPTVGNENTCFGQHTCVACPKW